MTLKLRKQSGEERRQAQFEAGARKLGRGMVCICVLYIELCLFSITVHTRGEFNEAYITV